MRAQVDVKEYRIPLLLLVVGFTILLIGSYLAHPALGFVLHLLVQVVQLAAAVAFGMAACYLVAKLWDTFFGDARSAIVKLAGIFTFTSAVSGLLGGFGFLVAWLLYLPLLMWLFTIEFFEAFVYAIILLLVHILVSALLIMTFVPSL